MQFFCIECVIGDARIAMYFECKETCLLFESMVAGRGNGDSLGTTQSEASKHGGVSPPCFV